MWSQLSAATAPHHLMHLRMISNVYISTAGRFPIFFGAASGGDRRVKHRSRAGVPIGSFDRMDTGTALLVGGGMLVTLQGLQTLQMWMAGRAARRIERSVASVAQSLRPAAPPRSRRVRTVTELREAISSDLAELDGAVRLIDDETACKGDD